MALRGCTELAQFYGAGEKESLATCPSKALLLQIWCMSGVVGRLSFHCGGPALGTLPCTQSTLISTLISGSTSNLRAQAGAGLQQHDKAHLGTSFL